jgi:hypothetical protein
MRFPRGIKIVRNCRKRLAMALAGAGIAVAAATPASACSDWGYSGIHSYGWAYANTGYSDRPVYSYRSCGGIYHIQGWGECDGFGSCGWAPFPPLIVTVPVTDAVPPGEHVTRTRRGRTNQRRAQSDER